MHTTTITTALLVGSFALSACTYSAPDYGACDPGRPSENVSLSAFEGPLAGMQASVSDVVAEVEADRDAYAYAADDRIRPAALPEKTISFGLSIEVDDEGTLIPASEGCEIDRLELTATTRVSMPSGDEVTGTWNFSLSRDTAQETFASLNEEQAHAVLGALDISPADDAALEMGFGARFVDEDDLGLAAFTGTGVISTLGGPTTPSTVLAQFGWDPGDG